MSINAVESGTGPTDVRRLVRVTLTLFITAVMTVQCWYSIDPQPGPLTRAVVRADASFISAWALLLTAAAAGLYVMVRFIVRSALPERRRGRGQTLLGVTAVIVLAAGTLAGFPAEAAAVAVLAAVASTWVPPKMEASG